MEQILPIVRAFQERDLPRLYQLDQICFPPGIAYSRAELAYFLTHPYCSCWVAELGENPTAGFLIIERVRLQQKPAGHIVTLDVDPDARRKGLGAGLIAAAAAQMKQEGAARIRLEVAQNNTAAIAFYRSLGFVVKGSIAKYYGGKIDADVMEKAI